MGGGLRSRPGEGLDLEGQSGCRWHRGDLVVEDEWFERHLGLCTPPGRVSVSLAVEIATVAGALVGTTKALVPTWVARQPHADMVAMTRVALDQLEPIWPAWLTGAPAQTWTISRSG